MYASRICSWSASFFINATATTETYTLSLHTLFRSSERRAALPAFEAGHQHDEDRGDGGDHRQLAQHHAAADHHHRSGEGDRKSTRLNSSHSQISYAVFCLKKKRSARGQPRSPRAPC